MLIDDAALLVESTRHLLLKVCASRCDVGFMAHELRPNGVDMVLVRFNDLTQLVHAEALTGQGPFPEGQVMGQLVKAFLRRLLLLNPCSIGFTGSGLCLLKAEDLGAGSCQLRLKGVVHFSEALHDNVAMSWLLGLQLKQALFLLCKLGQQVLDLGPGCRETVGHRLGGGGRELEFVPEVVSTPELVLQLKQVLLALRELGR